MPEVQAERKDYDAESNEKPSGRAVLGHDPGICSLGKEATDTDVNPVSNETESREETEQINSRCAEDSCQSKHY
jgi:hypothetical protein